MTNNFAWNKESENSIYESIDDLGYHVFACIMRDGTLQKFSGMWDEDYYGMTYIDIGDIGCKYSTDDIVMWIEIPTIEKEEKK